MQSKSEKDIVVAPTSCRLKLQEKDYNLYEWLREHDLANDSLTK